MKIQWLLLTLAVSLAPVSACAQETGPPHGADTAKEAAMSLAIRSDSFDNGQAIPSRFTADGADVSPALAIEGVPEGARSLALIVDDPDAPMGTWVHWVVWNLPPDTAEIPEGRLPLNAAQGTNSWGRATYGGPSPPSGTHRYFFKLYALDTVLDLSPKAGKAMLLEAMEGHILAQAELMGTYTRQH